MSQSKVTTAQAARPHVLAKVFNFTAALFFVAVGLAPVTVVVGLAPVFAST
jgi:hypothetical protein